MFKNRNGSRVHDGGSAGGHSGHQQKRRPLVFYRHRNTRTLQTSNARLLGLSSNSFTNRGSLDGRLSKDLLAQQQSAMLAAAVANASGANLATAGSAPTPTPAASLPLSGLLPASATAAAASGGGGGGGGPSGFAEAVAAGLGTSSGQSVPGLLAMALGQGQLEAGAGSLGGGVTSLSGAAVSNASGGVLGGNEMLEGEESGASGGEEPGEDCTTHDLTVCDHAAIGPEGPAAPVRSLSIVELQPAAESILTFPFLAPAVIKGSS
eukprot:gene13152-13282_t